MKLLLVILLASLVLNGYFVVEDYMRQVVVAVPDGDSLQLHDGRRIRLLGVDAPEKGRCGSDQSRHALSDLSIGKHVTLSDVVIDDYGRQLANVWIGNVFVQSYLVERGTVKYTGQKIHNTLLRQAEEKAQHEKLGIYHPSCLSLVPPDPTCVIKGNIRQSVKTYHLPGCPNYEDVVVDRAYGDEWFCQEQEAIASGFIKARGCK